MYDQTNYRFVVNNNDGTIIRARAYRLPSDWTTDAWSHYFDGDFVGFYEEYNRGRRPLNDSDECERAISAYQHARIEGNDTDAALRKVAQRITGQYDADFICVGLDRGCDFYVMTWGASPDWKREIEALSEGDIWRIECEELRTFVSPRDGGAEEMWMPADEYPEEFYGEDKAMAKFTRIFPLTEFPADLLVGASD